MIPDYSNLIKDIESLRSRGYSIAGVELNPITLQFASGQSSLVLTNADEPVKDRPGGSFYDGIPFIQNSAVPFGQYRILTKEPYQPQLREDFHK